MHLHPLVGMGWVRAADVAHLTPQQKERLRAPRGIGPNTIVCSRRLTKSHFQKGLFLAAGIGPQFFERTDKVAMCSKAVLDKAGSVWDMPVRLFLRGPTE